MLGPKIPQKPCPFLIGAIPLMEGRGAVGPGEAFPSLSHGSESPTLDMCAECWPCFSSWNMHGTQCHRVQQGAPSCHINLLAKSETSFSY